MSQIEEELKMEFHSEHEQLRSNFFNALKNQDKIHCVNLVTEALNKGFISIPELYEGILAPSLANIASNDKEQEISIWEEHVQSGIVRTIVELCFPYIIKSQVTDLASRPKAMVFCQEEEYHELGARMSADYLTLLGFDALFIGANTPKEEVYNALKHIKPVLVSISVTSFYHLSKLEDMIATLRGFVSSGEVDAFSLVVGGYAIDHTPNAKSRIKADFFAKSFEDLQHIKIKATLNVTGSSEGELSKVSKEIAREQFPSKEVIQ